MLFSDEISDVGPRYRGNVNDERKSRADASASFAALRAGIIAGQAASPTARASVRIRSIQRRAATLEDLFGSAADGIASPQGSFYQPTGPDPRQPR